MNIHDDYERKSALCDMILMAFDKNIKKDFPIPEANEVNILVKECLEKNKFSKKFRNEIEDLVYCNRDEYSRLESHIHGGAEWHIGREFFYGYGTLHRYYPDEKEKAEQNIKKKISKKEKTEFMVIHEFIKSKFKKGKYEVSRF